MNPSYAIHDMLRIVGNVLRSWMDPLLRATHSSDGYLHVVRNNVYPGVSQNEVNVHDPKFWLDVFASRHYWDGVFVHRTDRSQRRRAIDISQVRNQHAHFERWDVEWAQGALKVGREFLRLLGAETEAETLKNLAAALSTARVASDNGSELIEYDYETALASAETLQGRLLVLDSDQLAYVRRFAGDTPTGPWLLKGGPGSGKTVVALHCIKQLLGGDQPTLSGVTEPRRILFTTFTNSLVNAARGLLQELLTPEQMDQVTVSTIDMLARDLAQDALGRNIKTLSQQDLHSATARLLRNDTQGRYGGFPVQDVQFLVGEIDEVIAGWGLESLDEYIAAKPVGQRRRLSPEEKGALWNLHEDLLETERSRWLNGRAGLLFTEVLAKARKHAVPRFDYVFVDEAQDFKPVALSLAAALAEVPSNMFVAMDPNQSIYGRTMPWSMISDRLNFRGRAHTLRRNHRTTIEIWSAARELAMGDDEDGLDIEAVGIGPKPVLAWYKPDRNWREYLNQQVRDALVEEGLTPDAVTVVCPNNKIARSIVGHLDPDLNARAMKSVDFDMSHLGVKVTTIHAAKGLGFAFVAVVGVGGGTLPRVGIDGSNPDALAKEGRLLFVACSRAMNRLLVLASTHERSPLLDGITPSRWEIVEV